MAGVRVERCLGVGDDRGGVASGGGEHDLVLFPVRDQHRDLQFFQLLFVGGGAAEHVGAHFRGSDHVVGQHGLEFFSGQRLRGAMPEKRARVVDVRRQVVGGHGPEMFSTGRGPLARGFRGGAHEVDARDGGVAISQQVVADDAPGIRPAYEHRPRQMQVLHDAIHFVRPALILAVGSYVERFARVAVAAQVIGDEAEVFGEMAFVLLAPRQMALRDAVNENNFGAGGVAPLLHGEWHAVGSVELEAIGGWSCVGHDAVLLGSR